MTGSTQYHCIACGERLKSVPPSACSGCGRFAYVNPRPCAGAIVIDGDRVLWVRRAIEPWSGAWDLPGGFCESGEHPAETAVREVHEETGVVIELVELLGIWMDHDPSGDGGVSPLSPDTMNVYYLARPSSTAPPRPHTSEIAEAAWFARDAPPTVRAFPTHLDEVLAETAGRIPLDAKQHSGIAGGLTT